MAMRKCSVQTPKSKAKPRSPLAMELRRITLLLEDMDHRNRATIEAVFSTRDELRREFQGAIGPLTERVSTLEFGMRDVVSRLVVLDGRVQSHSETLAKHTAMLTAMNAKLDEHGRELGEHTTLLADHSERLERIEVKLDRQAEKQGVLEGRVTLLEKAVVS